MSSTVTSAMRFGKSGKPFTIDANPSLLCSMTVECLSHRIQGDRRRGDVGLTDVQMNDSLSCGFGCRCERSRFSMRLSGMDCPCMMRAAQVNNAATKTIEGHRTMRTDFRDVIRLVSTQTPCARKTQTQPLEHRTTRHSSRQPDFFCRSGNQRGTRTPTPDLMQRAMTRSRTSSLLPRARTSWCSAGETRSMRPRVRPSLRGFQCRHSSD